MPIIQGIRLIASTMIKEKLKTLGGFIMGTQALIAAGLVITNGRIAGNACKNELEESFSRKIDDFRHATDDKLNTILDCQKTTNKLMLKAAMSTMKAVDGNKEELRLFVNEMQEVINMDGSPKKA